VRRRQIYDPTVGRTYERIDERLASFPATQALFFVATAPADVDAHVNLSPKGIAGTFAIIDSLTVAYLDLTGSGVETIAHVRENGRITFMFCAFDGPPRVLRLYGRGAVVLPSDAQFEGLHLGLGVWRRRRWWWRERRRRRRR